jgi:hypothetical protein
MGATRIDYCQYLLVSQKNYTITNFADHTDTLSHDQINRYLTSSKSTPNLLWEHVKNDIVFSEQGYILFDDTVADKDFSHSIESVRRQYSGNAHGIIKGIGIVTCVYVNPETNQFWSIDYRVFDPDVDGKSKLEHVNDMIDNIMSYKKIPFHTVLMDSWYATKYLMLKIEALGKIYYCPLKKNRLVDDSGGVEKYKQIEELKWDEAELTSGKIVKLNNFPRDHRVKLFRVQISTNRTEHVATNNMSQNSADDTRKECAVRWKIEEFHRELKQLTGLEKCQCRKQRIQRNHIACAMLVWARLKQIAYQTGQTIYQVKYGLLDDYLRLQLKNPTWKFHTA